MTFAGSWREAERKTIRVGLATVLVVILMLVLDLAMLIWGSVVVFGAWSGLTEEWDEAQHDDYCPYSPMVMAFVLLILKWVSIGETSSGLISRVLSSGHDPCLLHPEML